MNNGVKRILKIDASARQARSHSRQLTSELVKQLSALYNEVMVTERDLYHELPFLSEITIESMYVQPDVRTPVQAQSLRASDAIIHELKQADILVLGVPVYNFGIPAVLKAWIDQMVRTGLTYRFEEGIFKGLLKNIPAYVVVTSNGVPLNSEADFVSAYLRYILKFVGIEAVHFIDATQIQMRGREAVMKGAMETIRSIDNGQLAMDSREW